MISVYLNTCLISICHIKAHQTQVNPEVHCTGKKRQRELVAGFKSPINLAHKLVQWELFCNIYHHFKIHSCFIINSVLISFFKTVSYSVSAVAYFQTCWALEENRIPHQICFSSFYNFCLCTDLLWKLLLYQGTCSSSSHSNQHCRLEDHRGK